MVIGGVIGDVAGVVLVAQIVTDDDGGGDNGDVGGGVLSGRSLHQRGRRR